TFFNAESADKSLIFSLRLFFSAALLLRFSLSNLFLSEGIPMPHLFLGDMSHSDTQELIGASIHSLIFFMQIESRFSETQVAVKLHILSEKEIWEVINLSNIFNFVWGLIFNSVVMRRRLDNLESISFFSNSPFISKSNILPKYLKLS